VIFLGAGFLWLLVFIYFTSSVKISKLYHLYNRNYGRFVGGRWPISYIFPYWNRKYEFCHNFRLNNVNDLEFAHKQGFNKGNIFWKFGENPSPWRHVTSYDVICHILISRQKEELQNEQKKVQTSVKVKPCLYLF